MCDSQAITAACTRVDGNELVVRSARVNGAEGDELLRLALPARVGVIAAGKAALGQAAALAARLDTRVVAGLVVAPEGTRDAAPRGFELIHAGHPLPTEASLRAAKRALGLARSLAADDLLVCAISGGASALLEAPLAGLTLSDLVDATRMLLDSGGGIEDVNTVRKALSAVKGGRLAAASAAPALCLALSDVPGDRIDLVGSGPAVADLSPVGEALRVVERLGIEAHLSPAVRAAVRRAQPPARARGHGIVLAGPSLFAAALELRAPYHGLQVIPPARQAPSLAVAEVADQIAGELVALHAASKPACAVWVREPSVRVCDAGRGGRNAHLALLVAERIAGVSGAVFLACGTDGVDGNTDAAGAVVDATSWPQAVRRGLDPQGAIARFDSGSLHAALGTAVRTGPTGVNFTDAHILMLERA